LGAKKSVSFQLETITPKSIYMEQLLLTSKNMSKHKIWNEGQLSLNQALEKLQDLPNVQLEAPLPSSEILLDWTEFALSQAPLHFGPRLLNGRLASYRFQYLGSFQQAGQEIRGLEAYETYSAKPYYQTQQVGTGACNVTWLLDFLLNARSIAQDPLRSDRLRWQEDAQGQFCLCLEAQDKGFLERQTLCFKADWSGYTWAYRLGD
jgi:hypothetical protein